MTKLSEYYKVPIILLNYVRNDNILLLLYETYRKPGRAVRRTAAILGDDDDRGDDGPR